MPVITACLHFSVSQTLAQMWHNNPVRTIKRSHLILRPVWLLLKGGIMCRSFPGAVYFVPVLPSPQPSVAEWWHDRCEPQQVNKPVVIASYQWLPECTIRLTGQGIIQFLNRSAHRLSGINTAYTICLHLLIVNLVKITFLITPHLSITINVSTHVTQMKLSKILIFNTVYFKM